MLAARESKSKLLPDPIRVYAAKLEGLPQRVDQAIVRLPAGMTAVIHNPADFHAIAINVDIPLPDVWDVVANRGVGVRVPGAPAERTGDSTEHPARSQAVQRCIARSCASEGCDGVPATADHQPPAGSSNTGV